MIGRLTIAALAALALANGATAQTYESSPGASRPGATAEQNTQGLAQLAQDVMLAQQIGYLAADKNMQAGYALLGDQIALVNSEINRRLDTLASDRNMQLPRAMNEQGRAQFEEMKNLNRDQFAQRLVAFVNDTYPRIIQGIEALSAQDTSPPVTAMASDDLPRLRDHMQTAQQLAEGGGTGEQKAEDTNRGPIQRKDDPRVIPDTTR